MEIINGLLANEAELWAKFSDTVAPSATVYRTETGYVVIGADEVAPEGAEAIGSVSDWYE